MTAQAQITPAQSKLASPAIFAAEVSEEAANAHQNVDVALKALVLAAIEGALDAGAHGSELPSPALAYAAIADVVSEMFPPLSSSHFQALWAARQAQVRS